MARSGARWRVLPEDRFGPYQTAKRRYHRWIEMGVIDRLFEAVAVDPDFEWLAIDATIIQAQAQALGRSRGGFGTELHAVVDAPGLPVCSAISPGQQNDMTPGCSLVARLVSGKVLADPAYDADNLHDAILDEGGEPVIPPPRHRKYQHRYDKIHLSEPLGH